MMLSKVSWKQVRLGDMLTYLDERVELEDDKEYSTIKVKRRHGGLEIREKLLGYEIKTKKQFRLIPGSFIISRIQCWHQAYAVVGDVAANTIASTIYDQFAISPEVHPRFFWWLSHTSDFTETVRSSASGVVIEKMVFNRHAWLEKTILIPPLTEQQRIVARIDGLAAQIQEARTIRQQAKEETDVLVTSRMRDSIKASGSNVRHLPFTEVARLERRPVNVQLDQNYQEIGVYSFGRGIFHKTSRTGAEVGKKDLYEIRAGDFILQVTFAWEGAVALAEQEDDGLYGSVRYLTFRVNEEICSPWYLLVYMKTREAISQLGTISPGSAGRNRVLSVKRLGEVIVPVVPLDYQGWMTDALKAELNTLKTLQAKTATELDALMPSILDRAFKGEL